MSRVRADRLTNRAGTGAPTFPNGAVITGVATATSFDGNATGLTGTPNIVVGSVTASGANIVGVATAASGLVVSSGGANIVGVATAASGLVVSSGGLTVDGSYKQTAEAVAALDIDLSAGNYFTKTIDGNSTFTFSNPPASGTAGSFTLELTHTSGTVTWPASVKWPADTPPTLSPSKTHLFVFVTDDGGTRYRGAALADYVN